MATPVQTVYDAFFAKIENEELAAFEQADIDIVNADCYAIMESAIPLITFPRYDLTNHNSTEFADALDAETIQLLSYLMKQEYFERTIGSWQNILPLYDEKDRSPANLVDKLNKFQVRLEEKIKKMQANYNRKTAYTEVFDYTQLYGRD